ncbi:TonB-dependent receptor [Aquimarina megaterium]|uniref:TonB-dependent receptor n=1 Tax=Aquimarina megaterium TaxID=1443666 RepID=UPI0009425FE3|nr:TonB-dependent receptor [Aquimarina megaterium]
MQKKPLSLHILLLFTIISQAQFSIKGTVSDEIGNPVEGAQVYLLGTSKGALTNTQGNYNIVNIVSKTYFVEVSYLGYLTITKQINPGKDEELSLDFVLVESSSKLDEVVVSAANRRLQNIQKTEASISAIGTKEIGQLQVKEFNQLNSIAPNFNTYDDGGPGIFTVVASRGISTIDVNPTMGVYVDDVPYFSTLGYPLALSDIDQIEVLRGPQGTLYGRNALAGVLKITTKRPKNELSGFATVGFGNLNSKELAFALNTPVVKNKLFFRTSARITERDGFITNEFNNKDMQNRKAVDANFRFKYFANDKLSLALRYNLQRRESDAYSFAIATPDNSLQDILQNSLYRVNFDADVFQEVLTQNLAFNLKYDFDTFAINAITSFQHTKQESLDEFDYTPFDIQSAGRLSYFHNFSQEIRLNSSSDTNFHWVGGVFFYQNTEERDDVRFFGTDIGFAVPDYAPLAPFRQIEDPETNRKGIAVFGQVTYDITDRLSLTGGLRADYEDVKASVTRTYSTPAIVGNSFSDKANFNAISPKAALGYDVNDNVFLFANFAKGFRPGGINTFVFNPEDAPFEPETSLNYELGIKTNLMKDRLKLNLTGFFINYKDQQVFTVLDLANFVIGTDNIGESRSYGLELESKWVAARGLDFTLNLGYLNTEITKYNPIDFNTGTTLDYSGNDLPLAAEFNGNLNINYKFPLNKKFNLETSVDYNYQSEFFFSVDNDILQDAYGLLNGRIGITSKNLDLFFWSKNITDEAYYSYGYGVGGFNAASFGLPQTYGATLTAKL